MEGVETDGWVTEMVRYVICPDEDIWYIWSDNARQNVIYKTEKIQTKVTATTK